MSSDHFFHSIVYDSPHVVKRNELWHFQISLAISKKEKGEASVSRVGCKWFREFLFDNALRDLGASGAKFTWCRGRECELRHEIEEVLAHEELLWFQKSRAEYRTLARRKWNKVEGLLVDNEKCFEDDVLKQHVAPGMDGFQASLFQTQWEIVGPSVCFLL
ncbi:hypothetical protein CXB51_006068 [Gossypium anomalum]|uniref:Uncharacterized protein n=1 Tax=Gossypium anomalum TaxID=47600 RepID=A0A8J5ZEI4_9ROSI|nr:hypothetical protein CXB51_006068 [Gossypium anomalum]